MSARAAILSKLTSSANDAAERALEIALADALPAEQAQLADVILERNRRNGWITLIRSFHRLAPALQEKILLRPRDLFGPLAETIKDSDGPVRENVINIVQRCIDVRLVYLLAEAMMDARPEVRSLAGNSLLEAVRRHCRAQEKIALTDAAVPAPENQPAPPGEAPAVPAQSETAPHPQDDARLLSSAIEVALRHYRTHRQQSVVLAALIHERQQNSDLWLLFEDPYDDRTRAATILLRAPAEPALARALYLALATGLKPAAMAGLASVENPEIAAALAAESFRLVDPLIRDAAQSVNHLKLLPAMRKNPPWNAHTWPSWLRLIESVGLLPAERLHWLTRLLEAAPGDPQTVAWRMCVSRAIADTALPEAAAPLALLIRDTDERVARFAARVLLTRRIPEWRDRAAAALPTSPHVSVRRMASLVSARDSDHASARGAPATSVSVRGFDRAWNDYQRMPPVVQHNTARTVAADPAFAEQLRIKFQGTPQDIAQALKMIAALPNLTPYRSQIIAHCGHADPRIAAHAVRLAGRLEDPRLRELLEAAAHHADPRVRSNAVESMEELQIADRSQQVLALLNSRHQRERATAIKALGRFNFGTARECLTRMLTDSNPASPHVRALGRRAAQSPRGHAPGLQHRPPRSQPPRPQTRRRNARNPQQPHPRPRLIRTAPCLPRFLFPSNSSHRPRPPGMIPPPAPAPEPHRMTFSDLQHSIHDYDTGKNNDKAFRNAFLVLLGIIAIIALLMHLRERRKNAAAPNSLHRLGRELTRGVPFPFAARWMLLWVARSTKTPFAALLLSGGLFDKCVQDWSSRPTFTVARRWGRARLDRLRPDLFT